MSVPKEREPAGSWIALSNTDSEINKVIHLTLFIKIKSIKPTHACSKGGELAPIFWRETCQRFCFKTITLAIFPNLWRDMSISAPIVKSGRFKKGCSDTNYKFNCICWGTTLEFQEAGSVHSAQCNPFPSLFWAHSAYSLIMTLPRWLSYISTHINIELCLSGFFIWITGS